MTDAPQPPIIKFSHFYYKMPGPELKRASRTVLLQVFKTTKNELSNAFAEYDTLYYEAGTKRYYPLQDGPLLVLVLKTGDWVWTTIRKWDEAKERYYRGLQGQQVETAIIKEG